MFRSSIIDLNVSPIILLLKKYKFKYDAKKAGEILNLSIQDIPGFSNSVKGLLLTVLGENIGFQLNIY